MSHDNAVYTGPGTLVGYDEHIVDPARLRREHLPQVLALVLDRMGLVLTHTEDRYYDRHIYRLLTREEAQQAAQEAAR